MTFFKTFFAFCARIATDLLLVLSWTTIIVGIDKSMVHTHPAITALESCKANKLASFMEIAVMPSLLSANLALFLIKSDRANVRVFYYNFTTIIRSQGCPILWFRCSTALAFIANFPCKFVIFVIFVNFILVGSGSIGIRTCSSFGATFIDFVFLFVIVWILFHFNHLFRCSRHFIINIIIIVIQI